MAQRDINYVISLIFSLRRMFQEKMQREGKNFSSFLQFKTLQYIAQEGRVRMKDVATFLSITPPSATSLINSLVKAGNIKRIADKNDRRIIRLAITPLGQKAVVTSIAMMNRKMKALLSRLTDQEVKQLTVILEKWLR